MRILCRYIPLALTGYLVAQTTPGSVLYTKSQKTEVSSSIQTLGGQIEFTTIEIAEGKDFQHIVTLDGKTIFTSGLIPVPVYLDIGAADGDTILIREQGGDHCRYRIVHICKDKPILVTQAFGTGAEAAISANSGVVRLSFPPSRSTKSTLLAVFAKGSLQLKEQRSK